MDPDCSQPEASLGAVRIALGALAAGYLLLYLVLAWQRVPYPFELEWLEGSVVDVVRRLLEGEPIYVKPSVDFASHGYTPLYYWVSAAVAQLTGVGFLPLRLVSFASILGVFALLFAFAKRETGSAFAGLVAAGMFAATFREAGAWFDIARVDSLFLLLTLAAAWAARFGIGGRGAAMASGLLFFLAYLTKQSALLVAACVGVWWLLESRRRAVVFGAAFVLPLLVSAWILDRVYDGWYLYYTIETISEHPVLWQLALPFWIQYVLRPIPLAFGVAAWFLARRLFEGSRQAFFHPALAAGMVGLAWSSRMHLGGYDNVAMTAYAAISLHFALGLHEAAGLLARRAARPRAAVAALWLAAALQLGWLAYDPRAQVPTAADRVAGEELLERLRAIDGEVYLPFHGHLAELAGKRSYAHTSNVRDVMQTNDEGLKAELMESIEAAFREKRFAAVVWDFGRIQWEELPRNYEPLPGKIFDDPGVFKPVTGARLRPETIYVPRK